MPAAETSTSFSQYARLFSRYLMPLWRKVLLLAVLLFGNLALLLTIPQILRFFIDSATGSGSLDALLLAAVVFLGVALAQQVLSVLATYLSEDVGWSSTNALRVDLARHCLQLDMGFHHERTPGEMIERVDGDVEALGRFFSQFVIQIVGNLVLLLGILAMLLREDWRAGWLLGLFVAGSLVVLNALRNLAVPYWKESRQKSAEHFGFLEERLAATEDIRSCRAQPYVLNQFYRLNREWFGRDLKAGFMTSITINSNWLLFAVGNAAALAVSAYLFHEGGITIGTAYLIFHYANMLEEPVNRITIQIQEFQRAAAGVERINELLSLKSRLRDSGSVSLSRGPLAVSFQEVTFNYDGGDAVLRDVSLELSPGTVLGLLGRTGSGKSTLARLLVRLHDPRAGCVCLGGYPLPQISLGVLRQRVGVVTQNVHLFRATVRDNLTYFDPAISDQRLQEVIQSLGLGDWFQGLPQGLDTELESGGGGLSAGEAQLLAFTRIFLRDPGVIILDEASSRLDRSTEMLVERAVQRLTRDRTSIIVAHHLATVQHVHEVMILEAGSIVEHGNREMLAGDPKSRFAGLLRTGLEEVLE